MSGSLVACALGPARSRAGYSWGHEDVNRTLMRGVVVPASVGTSLVLFKGLSRYFRVYLFTPENPRRITRAAALKRDFASLPPALTPARVWRMLGPSATAEAQSTFRRVYGRHLVVWAHAALFATIITAMVQPVMELPFTVRLSESARSVAERRWIEAREADKRLEQQGAQAARAGLSDPGAGAGRPGVGMGGAVVPGLLDSQDRR